MAPSPPPPLCLTQIPHPANCSTQRGSLPSDDIHPLSTHYFNPCLDLEDREACGFQNWWISGKFKGRLKLFWKFIHFSIHRLLLGKTWDNMRFQNCSIARGGGVSRVHARIFWWIWPLKVAIPKNPPIKKSSTLIVHSKVHMVKLAFYGWQNS